MTTVTTILGNSPDGPALIYEYAVEYKTTWVTTRSYGSDIRSGVGVFWVAQCPDTSGAMLPSWTINAGFVDNTAGRISSDMDFCGYSSGAAFNLSISGAWNNGGTAIPAMFGTWPSEILSLGSYWNRWTDLWLKQYPVQPGMPKGTKFSVKVNGGYVPVF